MKNFFSHETRQTNNASRLDNLLTDVAIAHPSVTLRHAAAYLYDRLINALPSKTYTDDYLDLWEAYGVVSGLRDALIDEEYAGHTAIQDASNYASKFEK